MLQKAGRDLLGEICSLLFQDVLLKLGIQRAGLLVTESKVDQASLARGLRGSFGPTRRRFFHLYSSHRTRRL